MTVSPNHSLLIFASASRVKTAETARRSSSGLERTEVVREDLGKHRDGAIDEVHARGARDSLFIKVSRRLHEERHVGDGTPTSKLALGSWLLAVERASSKSFASKGSMVQVGMFLKSRLPLGFPSCFGTYRSAVFSYFSRRPRGQQEGSRSRSLARARAHASRHRGHPPAQ